MNRSTLQLTFNRNAGQCRNINQIHKDTKSLYNSVVSIPPKQPPAQRENESVAKPAPIDPWAGAVGP